MAQCKKTIRKLKALVRVCTHLSVERRRTLMKAY